MTAKLLVPLALAATLVTVQSASAERIYRLVNYPDLQNGHTLRGTITTTDDAPNDGLLATEEILDWEWSISGLRELSASFAPPPLFESKTLAEGITISPSTIGIPRVVSSMLVISQQAGDGRELTAFHLNWFSRLDKSSGMISLHNSAGRFGGDFVDLFWNKAIDVQHDDSLTIATVVPEPPTVALCLVALFAIFWIRR